jgi:hypothetical protein
MGRYSQPHTKAWAAGIAGFKPDPRHEAAVNAMLDQVIAWGGALKPLRTK